MKKNKMLKIEFESRIDMVIRAFVKDFYADEGKKANSSVKDFQEELATCLAIQGFVKSVKNCGFEADQVGNTATLKFKISPVEKKCTPHTVKMCLQEALSVFGGGFNGEDNPFLKPPWIE